MTLSRRQALKVLSGTGLALYFSPMLFDPRRALAATGESDVEFLRRFSPIDRTLVMTLSQIDSQALFR